MREIIVDLNYVYTKDDLHDALQISLGLPDYYGRNLDALYDCLSTMYMYDEVCLVLLGTENLPEDMLKYAGKLIDVLDQVTDEYAQSGDSEFKYEIREESPSYVTPIPVVEKYPEISDDDIMGNVNPFKKPSDSPFKPASPFVPNTNESSDFSMMDDMNNDSNNDIDNNSFSDASTSPFASAAPVMEPETTSDSEDIPQQNPIQANSFFASPASVTDPSVSVSAEENSSIFATSTEKTTPETLLQPQLISSANFYSDERTILFEDESMWDELFVKTMILLRSYGESSSLDKIAGSEILSFLDSLNASDLTSEAKFLYMKYEANSRGELSRRRGIYSVSSSFFDVEEALDELFKKFVKSKNISDETFRKYNQKQFYRDYMRFT